jgi:hypothetical protein
MAPLDFNAPESLLLGLAIPWLWWISRESLSLMGTRRRLLLTGFRTLVTLLLVALLLVVCLAEPYWNRMR